MLKKLGKPEIIGIPHTFGRPGGLLLKSQMSVCRKDNGALVFTMILLGQYYDSGPAHAGKKLQLGDEQLDPAQLGMRIMGWAPFLESFFEMRGQIDKIRDYLAVQAARLFHFQAGAEELLERKSKAEEMRKFSSPQLMLELEVPNDLRIAEGSNEREQVFEEITA